MTATSIAPPRFPASPSLGRNAVRRGLVEWIENAGCTWCLTLNPNRSHVLATELSVLRLAFGDADRALLGSRYNRVDARKRLLAFIVPEHLSSNLHFHLALRPGVAAEQDVERGRVEALASAWQRRVASGTFELEPLINVHGWGRYITKELPRGEAEFVTSSMWWPERQRRHVLDRSWTAPGSLPAGVQ